MNACIHEDTQPGVFQIPSQEELGSLCQLYESCIGRPVNGSSAAIIEEWFEKVEFELILEAIRRTGLYARRPGAPYMRAILRNWEKQGIHTVKDLNAKEHRRSESRHFNSAMNSSWWNYQQHEYTEADLAHVFYDPTKDYS